MLTRRGLFERLGRSALGLAAVPLLAKLGVGVAPVEYRYVARTGPTLTEMVASTLRARSGQLADNVVAHNALFRKMEKLLCSRA